MAKAERARRDGYELTAEWATPREVLAARANPSAACEGCGADATTSDESGIPLCASCYRVTAEECEAEPAVATHPMWICGYEAGFADALNDAAPGLMDDLRWIAEMGELLRRGELRQPRATGLAIRARCNAVLAKLRSAIR